MSTHRITAQPQVRFHLGTDPIGGDDIESADPTIEIEYTYESGTPARSPSYYSGGEPAEGPELSLVSAKLIDGDGLDPCAAQVREWAEDWLQDAGYDRACEHAEASR